MIASILIISPAGRLRDGLHTILRTIPNINEIIAVDTFELGRELAARQQPAVLIIDSNEYLEDDCLLLKKLLDNCRHCCCVAITKTMQQAAQAREAGADRVLLHGFSTIALHQALISLDVVPVFGIKGQ